MTAPGGAGRSAPELLARLERVQFSWLLVRARIIMGSATFFDAFDALSLAFVLPVLRPLWHLSSVQIGWLLGTGYLGQLVGALVFGRLAERRGRIRAAAGATALMSVMSLLCATAGSLPWLIALRFVQGIGVGGEMPVAAAYINELSRAHGRGRFFLLYELLFPIGLMVTGQIGALLVPAFGWQIMLVAGGVPGLVITVLLLRLPESPRWLIERGQLARADAIITEIEASAAPHAAAPGPDPAGPAAPAATAGPRGRWRELLSPRFRRPTMIIWVLWTATYLITNGLNNWMPTLYQHTYHLALPQALRAGALNNVAQVVVLLGCAFVIDRIGRRRWSVACLAIGAALLAVLGLAGSGSVTGVVVLVSLSYGIIGSVNAVLYLYTPEIYPTRMRAIGTGAATGWLRIASFAGPLLVGYLVDTTGTGSVFLAFGVSGAIGAIAATRMAATDNRRLEELAA
ncbi:MAG TPA: MFS transporter [Kofleriaceae bacterium]|jgi:putative MFS transporter|nr:MFS transporter [Kofleriaceae bacterium]